MTVPEQGSVVHDVILSLLPAGDVTLRITSGESVPVVGAMVGVIDSPITGLVSDAAGEVLLDDVPAVPLTVRIGKFGHAPKDMVVVPAPGGSAIVEVELTPGFTDDFEIDQAWIVGAPGDDATRGIWERAIPNGSWFIGPVAPDEDASATGLGYAFVTEQNPPGGFVGIADIDNGTTTMLSPVFDATGLGDPTLSYQRWFSNRAPTQGDDEFRADVSSDGGASWTNIETLSVGTDSWGRVIVDLSSLVSIFDADAASVRRGGPR